MRAENVFRFEPVEYLDHGDQHHAPLLQSIWGAPSDNNFSWIDFMV